MKTIRTLRLRKDVLTELSESELGAVAGADATRPGCFQINSMPLYSCLFKCTEA